MSHVTTMADDEHPTIRRAGRIKDARGRRISQLDPVAMKLLHQHRPMDADVLRSIAAEQGVRIRPSERAALIGGVTGAVLVVSLFTYAVVTGDIRSAPWAKSASLFYLCALPWIIWFGIKRKRFGNIAAAMLRHLRCPHCGYDLRLLPVDPADGATVCPECGSAWRLDERTSDAVTSTVERVSSDERERQSSALPQRKPANRESAG